MVGQNGWWKKIMVEDFPFPGKLLQRIGLFLPALYGFNDLKTFNQSAKTWKPSDQIQQKFLVRCSCLCDDFYQHSDLQLFQFLCYQILTKQNFAILFSITCQGPQGFLSGEFSGFWINSGQDTARTGLYYLQHKVSNLDEFPGVLFVGLCIVYNQILTEAIHRKCLWNPPVEIFQWYFRNQQQWKSIWESK